MDDALANMSLNGVIIACGAISGYDVKAEDRYGNKNLFFIIGRQLRFEGFIVNKWANRF